MPKIAIIGAGWMGIGCLRILTEAGYEVEVFERLDDVGGLWHPKNIYSGFFIDSPAKQIEYFDFPLPNHFDKCERISAEQIYYYIKQYCETKKFYSAINFNTDVLQINYDSLTKKSSLKIKANQEIEVLNDYDYVIYTEGFTQKRIPRFKDSQLFQGQIIHTFDVKREPLFKWMAENKNIVVLGGSKSAADTVLNLKSFGYKATWIYKKSYWFLRYDIYRNIMQKNLKKGLSFDFYSFLIILGFIIGTKLPRLTFWLWRLFGLHITFGKKHNDHRKFHISWLSTEEINQLKNYSQKNAVIGKISHLKANSIMLESGIEIPADIIICCTGSNSVPVKISITRDNQPVNLENITAMYRAKVIPEIPNLFFTAFCYLGSSTLNGLNHGEWIKSYIEAKLDEDYLKNNASNYDYPFFQNHFLFNSKTPILKRIGDFVQPFLDANEVSYLGYLKSLVAVFFSHEPIYPLKFKQPKNFRKKNN